MSRKRMSQRSWCKAISVSILACVATGCTVGPDFTPPAPPTVTRYTEKDTGQVLRPGNGSQAAAQVIAIGGKPTSQWWTLFRSQALDSLVVEAIAGNFTLQSAQARLTEANEYATAASSALYPSLAFDASVAREKLSVSTFGLSPTKFPLPPNFNVFQLGPTASYTLDLFGGVHRQIERQTALADVERAALSASYLTITGDTAGQAIHIAALHDQLKAVQDILGIDRHNLDLVRKQRFAGTVPDSDVVTAEAQLAADETLRPQIAQQLDIAKHALSVLLGKPPSEDVPGPLGLADLTLPGELPLSLPSELVHRRPDIQAAEADLHAASAQIGVATARLYPSITLSSGISASALDAGHLFEPTGLVWSIAAGLTQPIFDGGLRKAERRAALAAFKASASDYQQTVLQAFRNVADILTALSQDADLLTAQQHALDRASESVRLQRIRYIGGGTGILDLLDAERQYQQARLGYIRAQELRFQDTVRLMVAMGGDAGNAFVAKKDGKASGLLAAATCPRQDGLRSSSRCE